MRAKLTLGLILCLAVFITSCHKYDKDDFLGIGANDKVDICKDGDIRTVKAKKLNYWLNNGYDALIDNDGDGFVTVENSCGYPVDCDDDNADVYPGAPEICDDEIDNNCNGLIDCEEEECASVCVNCDELTNILNLLDIPEGTASFGEFSDIRGILFTENNVNGQNITFQIQIDLFGDPAEADESNPELSIRFLGAIIDADGNEMEYSGSSDELVNLSQGAQSFLCVQVLEDFAVEIGATLF